MPDVIDKNASLFSTYIAEAKDKVTLDLIQSYKERDAAYLYNLLNTSLTEEMLASYGMAEVIQGLLDDYNSMAEQTVQGIAFQNVGSDTIAVLQELDEQFYFNHVRDVATQLKRELILATLSESNIKELTERLNEASKVLSESQINALVNTSLRTNSRTIFAEGAKKLPGNIRYHYAGPLDDRTRDICVSAITGEPEKGYTRAEINSLEVSFTDGGGFNCRHSWEVVI